MILQWFRAGGAARASAPPRTARNRPAAPKRDYPGKPPERKLAWRVGIT